MVGAVRRADAGAMHDPRLDELSESQHALIARRQMRELGYSNSAVSRAWTRSALWEALTPEVARRLGAPRTTGHSSRPRRHHTARTSR